MFFDSPNQIPHLAAQTGVSIFSFPSSFDYSNFIPENSIHITLSDKTTISVESIRDIEHIINDKQNQDLFICIYPADSLSESAMNACLKILESPKTNIHFALFTESPHRLLPTVHSRAHHYKLKNISKIDSPPQATDEQINLAKLLISATPRQLVELATEISKSKPNPRQQALLILDLSIQLLYKSYFKTGNKKYLTKLPQLLASHQAISNNGHVKLQLIAPLLP